GVDVRQPGQVGQFLFGVALVELLPRQGNLDVLLLRQVQHGVEVDREHLRLDLLDTYGRRRRDTLPLRGGRRGLVFLLGGGRTGLGDHSRLQVGGDAGEPQRGTGGQAPDTQAPTQKAGKEGNAGGFHAKTPTVSRIRAVTSLLIGSVRKGRNLFPLWG